MTNQEIKINRAIAEACGWRLVSGHGDHGWMCAHWHDPENRCFLLVPNYCADLNAMALAKASLNEQDWFEFARCLAAVTCNYQPLSEELLVWYISNATPRQEAEAFLRALGKWKEKP